MLLYELFDIPLYHQMLDAGYIRENIHPYHDLVVINYTEKAQYEQLWNEVTSQCRGLIVNSYDKVIARPFDKFHNYTDADNQYLDSHAIITDKMDGSLGILWQYNGDYGIATRGSFTSDQAIHATYLLKSRYKKFAEEYMYPGYTYMFEIIYPENRIVLNYGFDDLVMLGARDIEEGYTLPPNVLTEWVGPRTTTFPYKTLREALEAPPRVNAEGYVVCFPELDYRIKIKQADYVALHKIVTGLTERRVWENMREGKTLEEMCEIIPDEWHPWLRGTYWSIRNAFNAIKQFTYIEYQTVVERVGIDDRKKFAEEAKTMKRPGLLFGILDGKNIEDAIWKLVRPTAD